MKRSYLPRLLAALIATVGSLLVAQPAAALVISQVYGGGGNSGATLTHDFIELFNDTGVAVSLNGLSVQYASATGTGNFGFNSTALSVLPNVLLQPWEYFLIQEAQGVGGTTALPTPDFIDPTPIAMSATGAKVALVDGTASLGCNGSPVTTPCTPTQLALILDLVGYGNANFFEGTDAAPSLNQHDRGVPPLRRATGYQRQFGGLHRRGAKSEKYRVASEPPGKWCTGTDHACSPRPRARQPRLLSRPQAALNGAQPSPFGGRAGVRSLVGDDLVIPREGATCLRGLLRVAVLSGALFATPVAATPVVLAPGYQVELFASGVGSPSGMALSPAGDLYLSDYAGGQLLRIPAPFATSGNPFEVVASGISFPTDVAFAFGGRLFVSSSTGPSSQILEVLSGTHTSLRERFLLSDEPGIVRELPVRRKQRRRDRKQGRWFWQRNGIPIGV